LRPTRWLAIATTRRESKARRQQIDDFLSSRPWIEVGRFCAAVAQEHSLHLMPWMHPPCHIRDIAAALDDLDEQRGYRAAALLRQRMERCGVSRWHPDPIAAIADAERATARR
jgi:hypothetical protein